MTNALSCLWQSMANQIMAILDKLYCRHAICHLLISSFTFMANQVVKPQVTICQKLCRWHFTMINRSYRGCVRLQCLPMRCKKWFKYITHSQTSYLSRTHGRCPWRKNLSCGEISNLCTWQMWRNLKFLHMWINFTFHHMTDVEKSEISFIMCTIYGILLHFTLFCCKKFIFLRFTLFFAKSVCCNLRAIVWRKF